MFKNFDVHTTSLYSIVMKYEFKSQFHSIQTAMIEDWLNSFFIPDQNFPSYEVYSLYYDKPNLLERNDYRSRLRWYRNNENENWNMLFAEIKHRNIFGERNKFRHYLGDVLSPNEAHFQSGTTISAMTGFHQFLNLSPILSFSYKRKRYHAPDNSFSFNLDSNLKLEKVFSKNIGFHRQLQFLVPQITILELKTNDTTNLTNFKNQFFNFDDKGFSKYSFFYQLIQELQ